MMLMSDSDLVRSEALAMPEVLHRELLNTRLLRSAFDRYPSSGGFPVMSVYLQCAAGPGCLAVDDASLSMDPLTFPVLPVRLMMPKQRQKPFSIGYTSLMRGKKQAALMRNARSKHCNAM